MKARRTLSTQISFNFAYMLKDNRATFRLGPNVEVECKQLATVSADCFWGRCNSALTGSNFVVNLLKEVRRAGALEP